MALTYLQIPVNPADVFEDITNQVNDNLTSDTTLSIPRVKYHCETWTELQQRLAAEDKAEDTKSEKYPLLALIRNFSYDSKANDTSFKSSLTIVIVTQSTVDKLSEDREADNFTPILRPIRAELFRIIKNSRYFRGYIDCEADSKSSDSFKLGAEDKANKLPDYLDGIIIEIPELTFNPPFITFSKNGLPKTLSYQNNVSELTCSAAGNRLNVILTEAVYTSSIPATINYTIHTSHDDGASAVAIDTPTSFTFESETGEYFGYIMGDDGVTQSKLYFYYSVAQGQVTKFMSLNRFELLHFELGGFETPDYPFYINMDCTCNKAVITSRVVLADGGNVENDELFATPIADTGSVTITLSDPAPTTYRDIVCAITIDGPGNTSTQLESISYYNLS